MQIANAVFDRLVRTAGSGLTEIVVGYRITLYMTIKSLFVAVLIGAALVCSAGCNKDAPVPLAANSPSYVIVSESPDPASGRLAMEIKVPQQTSEATVKSVTESLINARKSAYQQIVIKTYLESVATSDTPYAISKLEDGQITHRFNSQAGQQRIPTH